MLHKPDLRLIHGLHFDVYKDFVREIFTCSVLRSGDSRCSIHRGEGGESSSKPDHMTVRMNTGLLLLLVNKKEIDFYERMCSAAVVLGAVQ